MKLLFVVSIILCLIFVHGVDEEDGVMILTDTNFDEKISEYGTVLVKFYAPWCGHCKKLAPEYAGAAQELKQLDPPVILAQVDCTEQKNLAQKYEIQGFPTIKLFKNGKVINYEGGRSKEDLVKYMKKHTSPLTTELTLNSFDSILPSLTNKLILTTTSKTTTEYKIFEEVAAQLEDCDFFYIIDNKLAEDRNFEMNTLILMVEGNRIAYSGEWNSEDIVKFVHGNELPPVILFSQDTARKLFGPQQTVHHQLLLFGSKAEYESRVDDYRQVALQFKGKALYIYVPPEEGRIYEYFGIDSKTPIALMGILMGEQMKKYKFPYNEFNAETFTKFSNDFVEGKIEPFLKSEDIPESQTSPVIKIVGKTFEEIALDKSKHVFVKFYAPWCGHCKALAPIYVELAEQLKKHDDIVIAEFDATANEVDHPEVNIRGYPTLKLFRAGDNKVIEFGGERDMAGMMKFLKENIPDFSELTEL